MQKSEITVRIMRDGTKSVLLDGVEIARIMTDPIPAELAHYGQQKTVGPEEKEEREATGHTQGRKGCKAKRINMAFWSKNYKFVQVMSRATGMTMTDFVNTILDDYRSSNADAYRRAKNFLREVQEQDER